jgi:DNA modification methylase
MTIESTELQNSTETAIGYIPCRQQPFYSLKDVQIFNENCLETMGRMPDNHIDLTITSPPYDNLRDYNGYSFQFEDIARELFRVTKKGGLVVWVVGDATVKGSETGTSFKQALYFMECGFNLHDTMIYHREKIPTEHNRYQQHFEYMFVFSKGKPKTVNIKRTKSKLAGRKQSKHSDRDKDGTVKMGRTNTHIADSKTLGNVWSYNVGYMHTTQDYCYKHPAMFPEKLAADHIHSWSDEGDLVYDCFGGSGTTIKMAHLQNRKAIMSEISQEYCLIAKKRIDTYLRQERLF